MRSTHRNHAGTLGFVPDQPPLHAARPGPLYPAPPAKRDIPTVAIVGIIIGALAILMCAGITIVGAVNPGVTAHNTADTGGAGTPEPWTPEPEKTTPKTVTVQLGETIVYTSGISGDEVRYTVTAGKSLTQTRYGTAPDKGMFFSVSATIQVTSGSTYACGCDFALVAKDGTVYEPVGFGFDDALDAVQINAGQKAAGLVVWDVPVPAIAGARVELRADLFAPGNQGFWQLP